jgi:hypothetical protein
MNKEIKIITTNSYYYNLTYKKFFNQWEISIVSPKEVKDHNFAENDVIVLFGPDVLSDYMLDVIIDKFTGCNNKIIALSVTLPNKNILTNTSKVNIIDYIFIQSKQDYTLFTQYFDPHRVFVLPDIIESSIDTEVVSSAQNVGTNLINRLVSIKNSGKKIICFSLSLQFNKTLTIILGHFLKFLLNFDYHIVFVPLKKEDINNHQLIIENSIQNNWVGMSNVSVVDNILEPNEYFQLHKLLYAYVATDFYPCYTAIFEGVPIFPIFTARNIKNLLLDIRWHYGYEMMCSDIEKMQPMELDIKILMNRFISFTSNKHFVEDLKNQVANLFRDFNFGKEVLKNILETPYSKYNVKSLQTNYISPYDKKIQIILKSIQDFAESFGYSDFRKVQDEHIQDIIVCIVSFHLTDGKIRSIYNDGLKNKMFNLDYDYYNEWKWIIVDFNQQPTLVSNPYGLFNLGFIDQVDYSESHRSGWQYVYDNIKYLHCDKSDLLLDLYIDRTFHWNKEINKALGIIPFKKYWIGFIHHTFDTSFSDYNCYNLLSSEDFKLSLPFCKGLFVLSNSLKEKLESQAELQGIPVFLISHPIETNVPKFDMEKFLQNSDKKLIHVGGWLRNTYAFYNLNLPQETKIHKPWTRVFHKNNFIRLRKVVLKGKNMNNYYPELDFIDKLHSSLISSSPNALGNISCSPNALGNISSRVTNNWYWHFYEDILRKCKSIDVMGYLDNKEYDRILTENIVFIYLVDASAVNTLLECVIRNTPIIVNKIPAVVEVLGEKYPLYITLNECLDYYDINRQVNNFLKDTKKILSAYKYLQKLDKEKLSIRQFQDKFINTVSLIHKTIVI